MPDKRVTELEVIDLVSGVDLVMVVDDPLGLPVNKKATVDQMLVNVARTNVSNTFAGDQTIDGDLFVTGEVNPVVLARQTLKLDQLEGRSVGDPVGSRTLLSRSLVSGLSVRHDEDLALGKITVGNLDTQTYQPLKLEVESFQVCTGVNPGNRVENLRVHPSGGVTMGGVAHTDPGNGMVSVHNLQATSLSSLSNIVVSGDAYLTGKLEANAGLGSTPLNASQLLSGTVLDARLSVNVLKYTGGYPGGTANFLRADGTFAAPPVGGGVPGAHATTHNTGGGDALTALSAAILTSGTLPDARLSSNIPRLDVVNDFQQQQTIRHTAPGFSLIETDAAANQKNWQVIADGQVFRVVPVNDAWVSLNTEFMYTRAGLLSVVAAAVGTTPAQIGVLRIPNNQSIMARSVGNDSDITLLRLGTDDAVYVGGVNVQLFAKTSFANTFTTDQTISTAYYPSLVLRNTALAVDARNYWIRINQTGDFIVQAINDANTVIQAQPLTMNRLGDVTVERNFAAKQVAVQVATGTAATLNLIEGSTLVAIQNNAAYLRINTTTYGQVTYMDMAGNWTMNGQLIVGALFQAGTQLFAGTSNLIGGLPSLSDSTTAVASFNASSQVRIDFGGYLGEDYAMWMQVKANAQNTSYNLRINPLGGAVLIGHQLTVGASAYVAGSISSGYYLYPGNMAAPGTYQNTWFLASHSSYGLYCNTGLYCVGPVWTTGVVTHAVQFQTVHTKPTGRRTAEFNVRNFPGADFSGIAGWIPAKDDEGTPIYLPYWK